LYTASQAGNLIDDRKMGPGAQAQNLTKGVPLRILVSVLRRAGVNEFALPGDAKSSARTQTHLLVLRPHVLRSGLLRR